jgi:hypothetical protein
MQAGTALVCVKVLHTIVWAFLAACVLALPIAALAGHHRLAAGLAAVVLGEVVVLLAFRWRCPLTGIAARYTADRAENFDIYLPLWVARYNKAIFGTLFIGGGAIALWAWLSPG